MKALAITFWAGQLIALLCLLVGAAIEIESILVTGPILAILGLILGLLSGRLQSWLTLGFALSGPLVVALVALMIAVFRLGPQEARRPVIVIVAIYGLSLLPFAAFAIRRIRRWNCVPSASMAPPWQFSLRTLLVFMTGFCMLAAAVKLLLDAVHFEELLIFGGFALVVFSLCGVVIWRFIAARNQPRARKPDPCPAL